MKWTEKEIEFLKESHNKNELIYLIPGRTWESIRKKRRKVFTKALETSKKWSEQEINIISDNYENLDKETLMNLLPGRTWNSIKLKSNSIGKNRSFDFRRESNMKILIEDKLESFYWIGFILADGHISDESRIKIMLSIKDLKHLEKYKAYLECDKISIVDKMCYISIHNKEICPEICNKFHIESDKTYNPPNLSLYHFSKELLFALIIGIIDGDGCINKVYKRQDCNLRIHLHKSWLENLIFIENFLYDYFSIKKEKIYSKIGNDGYSILTISDNTLLKKIKKECLRLEMPIMYRKWSILDENRDTKSEKFQRIKETIIILKSQGFKNVEVIRNLKISKSTFYKYIQKNSDLNH
jgi:hypothetical protein